MRGTGSSARYCRPMLALVLHTAGNTPTQDNAPAYWAAGAATLAAILGPLVAYLVARHGNSVSAQSLAKTLDADRSALARTIHADREGRYLERRMTLYGDVLTFVAERRQHRDVVTAVVTISGVTQLDPFNPVKIFDLQGRAHALADPEVMAAFDAADNADIEVIRSVNYTKIAQGDPDLGKRYERMLREKEDANAADAVLESAIRTALHREPGPALTRPDMAEEDAISEPSKGRDSSALST